MTEENIGSIPYLYLSIQQALLGEVGKHLRGLAFEWEYDKIILYFYHDSNPSSEDIEDYSNIGGYVVSHYNSPVTVEERVFSCPPGKPFPRHSHWAFKRKD